MEVFEIHPTESPPGLRLIGELDMATRPVLEEALETWGTSRPLTLDLHELTFIDGSTARVLLRHAKAMNGVGPLVLDGPSGLPLRVLEILGFVEDPQVRIRSVSAVATDG